MNSIDLPILVALIEWQQQEPGQFISSQAPAERLGRELRQVAPAVERLVRAGYVEAKTLLRWA